MDKKRVQLPAPAGKGLWWTSLLMASYIGAVLFCCLGSFSGIDLDLSNTWMGIPKDKIAHFFIFSPFPIVFAIFLKYNGTIKIRPQYSLFVIIVAGLIISTILESSQALLTDYRSSDPADLCANYTAIISGSTLICVWRFLRDSGLIYLRS